MAAKTPQANYGSLTGNRLRCLPVRNTASSGRAQGVNSTLRDVPPKETYKHQIFYFSDVDPGPDTWSYGKPIRCCAWTASSAGSVAVSWNPEDETGTVSMVGSGLGQYGWLHIWSRD